MVCAQISTSLAPQELLSFVKDIETGLGRKKTVAKGPRTIDLDVLFYDDEIVNDDQADLRIPHRLMLEREFVLRPLNEYVFLCLFLTSIWLNS
jgi:2-amino-4-hydroxy-6-hydroxymethyldihydropteridine diphosphokinase